MTDIVRVDERMAREASVRALTAVGVPETHAVAQTDLLIEAELRGVASHGLLRLPRVVRRVRSGATKVGVSGVHQWRAPGALDVDGQHGLGPVVAAAALAAAMERAKEQGSVVIAIRNNSHIGMLAYYAERVASTGLALIAMTTSEALVHPSGGSAALVGSNPIAIGVPASPRPLVVDLATAAVSAGKIIDHRNRGVPLQEGWAIDRDGNSTTDPEAARQGAISPFGGSKGYALGVAIGALTGWLTQTAFGRAVTGTLDDLTPSTKGDLFVILQPAPLGSVKMLSQYLDELRSSPPFAGHDAVRVPGDRAAATREGLLTEGIPLPQSLWSDIIEMGEAK